MLCFNNDILKIDFQKKSIALENWPPDGRDKSAMQRWHSWYVSSSLLCWSEQEGEATLLLPDSPETKENGDDESMAQELDKGHQNTFRRRRCKGTQSYRLGCLGCKMYLLFWDVCLWHYSTNKITFEYGAELYTSTIQQSVANPLQWVMAPSAEKMGKKKKKLTRELPPAFCSWDRLVSKLPIKSCDPSLS